MFGKSAKGGAPSTTLQGGQQPLVECEKGRDEKAEVVQALAAITARLKELRRVQSGVPHR